MAGTERQTGEEVLEKTRQETKKPELFKVLLLNDDYTTMDFVVEILEGVFNKAPAEAFRIMMAVHTQGQGLCGVYPFEVAAQLRQIGAARGENPLAVRIVRQRVQQMLERQVRVTPGGRLAIGDGEDDFQRRAEHYSGSSAARSGKPLLRASSTTVATFVSATS